MACKGTPALLNHASFHVSGYSFDLRHVTIFSAALVLSTPQKIGVAEDKIQLPSKVVEKKMFYFLLLFSKHLPRVFSLAADSCPVHEKMYACFDGRCSAMPFPHGGKPLTTCFWPMVLIIILFSPTLSASWGHVSISVFLELPVWME